MFRMEASFLRPYMMLSTTSPTTAYIALGSNLGDRRAALTRAINEISARVGPVTAASTIYETLPLNPPELQESSQPDFLNAVVQCSTLLDPFKVLDEILQIEIEMGRERAEGLRWGPRIIDIDLLAVGSCTIATSRLRLPHPELHKRDFVLVPFAEIAPTYVHPILERTVQALLDELRMGSADAFIRP